MNRALTIGLAAVLAAGAVAAADEVGVPYYVRGPRIIHVPQRGDDARETQASLPSDGNVDNEDAAPPPWRPRPAVQSKAPPKPQIRRSVRKEPPPARRKLFSVTVPPPPPEPTGPRRALLSAPPPPLADGPTPLRPTPRFGQSPLTPESAPVIASAPPPNIPAALLPAPEDDDDSLPPPGDPRLAPPEPKH